MATSVSGIRRRRRRFAHHGGLVRAASGRVALSEVRGNGKQMGRARHASGGLTSRLLVIAQKSPAFFIRVHQTKLRHCFVCVCFVIIIINMPPRSAARQGRYETHRPSAPLARRDDRDVFRERHRRAQHGHGRSVVTAARGARARCARVRVRVAATDAHGALAIVVTLAAQPELPSQGLGGGRPRRAAGGRQRRRRRGEAPEGNLPNRGVVGRRVVLAA